MEHYLPGCHVKLNHKESTDKIEAYMKQKNVMIEKCCKVKNRLAEPGETIIQNCTQCEIILNETHPENSIISLYEYILNQDGFPWVNHHGEQITIQDCWRTREDKVLQDSVRKCLKLMNFDIVEMPQNHENTEFCGVWRFNPVDEQSAFVAPGTFTKIKEGLTIISEEKQKLQMNEWVKQYKTKRVAVYCNGCEKGIKIGGGYPIHIIDLLANGL